MGWYLLTIFCAGLGIFLIGLAAGMKFQQRLARRSEHLRSVPYELHPLDWWEIEGWR